MPTAIVINLDRSTDRLAHITQEFARVGMAFERFRGVDRTDLPDSVKAYFCDASGRIASPLRPGEIGCYASHLAVWQRISAGDYGPSVLVCEDDMVLPEGFAELVSVVIQCAPNGWDLINLSGRTKRAVVPVCEIADGQHHLVRFSRDPGSLAAYLISQDGARKLLRAGIRRRQVDQDTRRPWAFGLRTFGLWPPLQEASLASTNDHRPGKQLTRSAPLDLLLRPVHGFRTLGFMTWARCATWNIVGRKLMAS